MTTGLMTHGDLRSEADRRLLDERYREALHAYAVLLRLAPNDLEAFLRVGDCLLALGELQRAAVVYTSLARHASHGGHPLFALVALKILTTLEPLLGELLADFATLYGKGSPKIGRGARFSLPDGSAPLPQGFELAEAPPVDRLVAAVEGLLQALRDKAAYPERVPPLPLFSELPADAFARLLAAVKLRRCRPGEVLIAEGAASHAFFVLARGQVVVERGLAQGGVQRLARLHAGAIFGERALVASAPRTATVRAVVDCDLLELDREALEAAADDVAALTQVLHRFTRDRLLQNLLASARLFRPLDRRQRRDLARRFTAHEAAAGTPLVRRGEEGRGLFVVLSGAAEVWTTEADGDRVSLALLGPGEVFGEISLLHATTASANVTAAEDSTVLFLARAYFTRLVEAVPEIAAYVQELGEERLMDTRLRLEEGEAERDLEDDELVLL
jgi:CRP-like cAMP-binding protein